MMVLVVRLASGKMITIDGDTGAFVMNGCPEDIIEPSSITGNTTYGSMSTEESLSFDAHGARSLVRTATERQNIHLDNAAKQVVSSLLDQARSSADGGFQFTRVPLDPTGPSGSDFTYGEHTLLTKDSLGNSRETALGTRVCGMLRERGFECDYKMAPNGVIGVVITWFDTQEEGA